MSRLSSLSTGVTARRHGGREMGASQVARPARRAYGRVAKGVDGGRPHCQGSEEFAHVDADLKVIGLAFP